MYTWGYNEFGQLGIEDRHDRLLPTLSDPPMGEKWISIAAGGEHSFGLTQNYNLYSWGSNSKGQLGGKAHVEYIGVTIRGFNRRLLNPPEGEEWKGVMAMEDFSFGFTKSGNMYAWGDDSDGQLGLGDYEKLNIDALDIMEERISYPRLLKPPLGERWKIDKSWFDLRIIFIAYHKEPSSGFYKENLPLEIFKLICNIV